MAFLVITYALAVACMAAGGYKLFRLARVKGSATVKIGNGQFEAAGEAILFGGGLFGALVLTIFSVVFVG